MYSPQPGFALENAANFGAPPHTASFGGSGPNSIPAMMTMGPIFPFGATSPPNAVAAPSFRGFGAPVRVPSLTILRQPPGTITPNRSFPRIQLRVEDLTQEERAHVTVQADLVDPTRNHRLADALQGPTTASIEDDFTSSFSRLKIVPEAVHGVDFSAALALEFQLFQHIVGRGSVPIGNAVRSNLFALVSVSSISSGGLQQSSSGPTLSSSGKFANGSLVRSNSSSAHLKRKRSDSDMDDDSVDYEDQREIPISYGGSPVNPPLAPPRIKRVKSEPSMKAEIPQSPPSDGELATMSSPAILQTSGGVPRDSQSAYVDITDLLSLPQKDAAARLGISESMLCKRFKECTRRKWPYRYLRKVEKQISQLNEQRQVTGYLTHEESARLEGLMQERDDCLAPVRIRVTNHDVAAGSPVATRTFGFSSSPADAIGNGYGRSNSFSKDDALMEADEDDMDVSKVGEGDEEEDDDEWTSVAKTLEQLRAMGGSRGPPSFVQ